MKILISILFFLGVLSAGVHAQASLPTCPGGESGGGGKPWIATFYASGGHDYVSVTHNGSSVCVTLQVCTPSGYTGSTMVLGYDSATAANGYVYVKDQAICGTEIN
jgi:hypothetical protein